MKIVVVHNFYQGDGGEDRVFEDEVTLLQSHGQEVVRFTEHNSSISERSKLAVAIGAVWNRRTANRLRRS